MIVLLCLASKQIYTVAFRYFLFSPHITSTSKLHFTYLGHPNSQVQDSDSPVIELLHKPQDWICLSVVVQSDRCCEMS